MTGRWRDLPAPARALATAVEDAVAAAGAGDAGAFGDAAAALGRHDPERVRLVLGGVLRALVERDHPAGLEADDVRQLLGAVVTRAASWGADVDPGAVAVVVLGALGEHDEETAALAPVVVARHAALVVAHLLAEPARPLEPVLRAALAELARAETVEMP